MAYRYTTVDYPNGVAGSGTFLAGVNNLGQISGDYSPLNGAGPQSVFIDNYGTFTTVPPFGRNSVAGKINDLGQLSGSGLGPAISAHGVIYDHGNQTDVSVPGAVRTEVYGINNRGDVVGTYIGHTPAGTYASHNFVERNGVVTNLDVPGTPEDINGRGQILTTRGLLDTDGTFTQIDVPGATITQALGFDGRGRIVGSYTDGGGKTHGFLDTNGRFTTLDVPGATSTEASDINNWGETVGSYADASGTWHGFIAAKLVASAIGHPDTLRDLLPGWVQNKAAQALARGSSWLEQHPMGPAMSGALETHDVAMPYAMPTG
jgi:hypothetical protein